MLLYGNKLLEHFKGVLDGMAGQVRVQLQQLIHHAREVGHKAREKQILSSISRLSALLIPLCVSS